MSVITSASLLRRTGPAVVKWVTNAENKQSFDTIPEAVAFAMQFGEKQRSTLWIEFATGEVALFPEIAELSA